jgi:ubiquitin-conjugating enzyme E2 Z
MRGAPGPEGTPYHGGMFLFLLLCPPDYPFAPPKVRARTHGCDGRVGLCLFLARARSPPAAQARLMNTDGGRVRFNPNFYANGKVRACVHPHRRTGLLCERARASTSTYVCVCAFACMLFWIWMSLLARGHPISQVCLSILGTWEGPGWSASNSLGSVLLSIQSLMTEARRASLNGRPIPRSFV